MNWWERISFLAVKLVIGAIIFCLSVPLIYFYFNRPVSGMTLIAGSTVAGGSGISDDFSTDTSSNYTTISGSIAYDSTNDWLEGGTWATSYAYHETALTVNHWVQADCYMDNATSNTGSGLIVATDGTDYVSVHFNNTPSLRIEATYNGGHTYGVSYTYATDTAYTIKAQIASGSVSVWVNDSLEIDAYDISSYVPTNAYYVGTRFKVEGSGDNAYLDNLTADDN